ARPPAPAGETRVSIEGASTLFGQPVGRKGTESDEPGRVRAPAGSYRLNAIERLARTWSQ
ncbi:MAG TPA: hypothetical protein VHJ17_13475, partial [Thermomonospora sp.]|nr:hypothetical protein [Thermomonospora sp.]